MFSSLEKSVFKQGYRLVAGIDEVGRGPLAGPVAAAVVCIGEDAIPRDCFVAKQILSLRLRSGKKICLASRNDKIVRDSKRLSPKQREEIFEAIKDNPKIHWQVSFVQPKTIDRVNIWQATLLAWRRCLKKLSVQPDFLFLDGKFDLNGNYYRARLPRPPQIRFANLAGGLAMTKKCVQMPIIKGDQKIPLLSLASIIAKVKRDRLMEKMDKKYPEYGFACHKGYGTKLHLERLKKYGPCPIHRRSFKPVFDNLSFSDKVYYITQQIPRGETLTYKQVAERIGRPKSFRAVGNVLNKNFDRRIPCYRVIRSDGKIGGYNRGGELKNELLKKEKVQICF